MGVDVAPLELLPGTPSPASFMKPAETTRSGWYAATASVNATSQASRSGKSRTRRTKVGTPAASALSRAGMSGRSAPTATICAPYAGSAVASSEGLQVGARARDEDDHPGRHGAGSLPVLRGGSLGTPVPSLPARRSSARADRSRATGGGTPPPSRAPESALSSSAVQSVTSRGWGPRVDMRPPVSPPRAITVSRPASTPVSAPAAAAIPAVTPGVGTGAAGDEDADHEAGHQIGTARPTMATAGVGPSPGSAASSGKAGRSPRLVPDGATRVPEPDGEARPDAVGHRPDDRDRYVGQAQPDELDGADEVDRRARSRGARRPAHATAARRAGRRRRPSGERPRRRVRRAGPTSPRATGGRAAVPTRPLPCRTPYPPATRARAAEPVRAVIGTTGVTPGDLAARETATATPT